MLAEIGVRTNRPGDALACGEGVWSRWRLPDMRGDSDRLQCVIQRLI